MNFNQLILNLVSVLRPELKDNSTTETTNVWRTPFLHSWASIDWLGVPGVPRQPWQHPRRVVVALPALPDPTGWTPRGAVPTLGDGRQRRVQEPRVAVRANPPWWRGLRAVCGLLAPGHLAPACTSPVTALLGDSHRHLPDAVRWAIYNSSIISAIT